MIEQNPVPTIFKKNNPKKTPLQLDIDWRKPLLLDLKIKPSAKFIGGLNEDGEEEEVDFEWHCKSGLLVNIQTVKNEFCDKRKLKPFKTLITGPPCSGKSFYGQQLAEHFNVPHIHVRKLLEEIDQWGLEQESDILRRN